MPKPDTARQRYKPFPAPLGRSIAKPENVIIAHQLGDRKCALYVLQGAVQEMIDFEPYLDLGDAEATADNLSAMPGLPHGVGGRLVD